MTRLGITVGLDQGSLPEAVDLAAKAEALGYTDAWSAEVGGSDGVSPLAALSVRTTTMRLGTAILPVFTRPPALLAMSAASVANLSGGRFVLGLGTSSSIIVENWMGERFERPLTRMREYVEAVRAALDGRLDFEGRTTRAAGFKLTLDPGTKVPVYVAALNERACRLAGEVADGVIFFLKSAEGVRRGLTWVAEGAAAAGRSPDDLDCVIRIPVFCEEDPGAVAVAARRSITTYAAVDVYNRSLAGQGYADESRAITEAWSAGDRKGAAAAVSDAMVNELFIVGDRDHCRERIEEFRAAGVSTPVLLPISLGKDSGSKISSIVEALAP